MAEYLTSITLGSGIVIGGQFQAVADSDIQFSNITTGNVSPAAHGFAPAGSGSGTTYLDDTGAYSTPSPGTPTLIANDGGSVSVDSSGDVLATPTNTFDVIIAATSGGSASISVGGHTQLVCQGTGVTVLGHDYGSLTFDPSTGITLVGPSGGSLVIDTSGNVTITAGFGANVTLGLAGGNDMLVGDAAGNITLGQANAVLSMPANGYYSLNGANGGLIECDNNANISIASDQNGKVAFFNGPGAVQYNGNLGLDGTQAGSVGSPALTDFFSNGGVGTTDYSFADVIAALKNFGLLAM